VSQRLKKCKFESEHWSTRKNIKRLDRT